MKTELRQQLIPFIQVFFSGGLCAYDAAGPGYDEEVPDGDSEKPCAASFFVGKYLNAIDESLEETGSLGD